MSVVAEAGMDGEADDFYIDERGDLVLVETPDPTIEDLMPSRVEMGPLSDVERTGLRTALQAILMSTMKRH
jgi:hypothetical protein